MGRRKTGLVFDVWVFLLLVAVFGVMLDIPLGSGTSDSWVWVRNTITGAYGEAVVGTGEDIYIARGTSFYRYRPADGGWLAMATPPSPDGAVFKTGTALAWDGGSYIYALFGASGGESRRWFYRYSISNNSWEALQNTPADQGEGDAIAWVSSDKRIYVTIGGEERNTYFVRYDPATNTWNDAAVVDPPAGMGDGASLVWTGNNYLYALRGEFYEPTALYDFWRYDLAANIWTSMADIPATPHNGGVGGVGDGGSLLYIGLWLSNQTDFIYALSGNQAYPESPQPIPDNRFYRYTISTNSWERLADLPFGVGHYVGCRLGYANGHIYAWQGAPSTWAGGGDDLAQYKFPSPLPPDSTPPTTSISLSGVLRNNDWFTSTVTVTLSAIDDISGVDKTEYSFDNATWTTYNTPFTITSEGNNIVYYKSTDKAGNQETIKTKTIKIDKTLPSGVIKINNDATYSTSTSVTLTLTVADATSGVYQVRYSNDGVWDTEPWETPLPTKPWTLPSGDGTKTVYYQVKDNAGLISTHLDKITLDTTPPTGSITIAGGATHTNSLSVTLTLSAQDATSGVAQMRFSHDNTTWTPWETYFTSKTWTLTTGDGTKTVYVQYMDNAGLVSSPHQDTITLDATKPTANAGQDHTVNVGATVNFDASGSTDNIGIVSFEWNFGDGITGTGKTTTHTYTNPRTYTVTLTVKDAAGNIATHTITVTVLSAEAFPMWIIGLAIAAIGIALAATVLLKKRKQPKR